MCVIQVGSIDLRRTWLRLVRLDSPTKVTKDGRSWRIGTPAEFAWIEDATTFGRTITAAISPIFEAYATFHELDDEAASVAVHERAVVEHLVDLSGDQPW